MADGSSSHAVEHDLVPRQLTVRGIFEFAGEKLVPPHPLEKDLIAFPERQVEDLVVVDPLEIAFRRNNQVTGEVGCRVDKDVPIFDAVERREGEKTVQLRIGNRQAAFLEHFTLDAFFRGLPGVELAAEPVPFAFVHIALLLDPMQHQGLSIAFYIAERGKFHGAR